MSKDIPTPDDYGRYLPLPASFIEQLKREEESALKLSLEIVENILNFKERMLKEILDSSKDTQ